MSNEKEKKPNFYNFHRRNFTNNILNYSKTNNSNSTLYSSYKTNSNLRKNNKTLRDSFLKMNSSLTKSSYNNYINRPIVNFTPKMPLHNLDSKSFINPSKLKYTVSVVPPSCHLKKEKIKKVEIILLKSLKKDYFHQFVKIHLIKQKKLFYFSN